MTRLSVDRDDPGYPAWRALHDRGAVPIVTIDGAVVKQCITVDTKRGWVVANDLDSFGKAQRNSKRNAVKRKVLVGHVSVAIVSATTLNGSHTQ